METHLLLFLWQTSIYIYTGTVCNKTYFSSFMHTSFLFTTDTITNFSIYVLAELERKKMLKVTQHTRPSVSQNTSF